MHRNTFISVVLSISLMMMFGHISEAVSVERQMLAAAKKAGKSRYQRVLEVYTNDQSHKSGNTSFSTSTSELKVALHLGKTTSQTFVFIVVTDKTWKKTIFQIPVVVDTKSGTTITTLKRPMSGWIKGVYEVVVKDTKENIISTANFSITDEKQK